MRLPRTLFGRLMLILVTGLGLAQLLTLGFVLAERGLVMRGTMVTYLATDVASSVAMLDRLPATERAAWLPRLQRSHYQLHLGGDDNAPTGPAKPDAWAQSAAQALSQALSQPVRVAPARASGSPRGLHLQLQDGTPLRIDMAPPRLRLSPWLMAALLLQLLLLSASCWLAVRQATRPLDRLAHAADELEPGRLTTLMPETGPREVVQAARAFNRMRERIDAHLSERSQMLGAISHDLQTPLTRMRLRADLVADETLRDKLQADLAQMQHLVEQGLAYARTEQAPLETEAPTALGDLLESIVADYQDAAQPVSWRGGVAATVTTRPQALRRAIGNLIDNALKFGGAAEVELAADLGGLSVRVLDRGPGIAAEELPKVLQPYYRIEASRNLATGGSGLGLAIVQRLAPHCRAELRLEAREGGGLAAKLRFKRPAWEAAAQSQS